MAIHQQAKNREYEHHGIVFKTKPGSRREALLLDMFQAHDRAATKPGIIDPQDPDHGRWFLPLVVGLVAGMCAGILIGWGAM